MYTTKVGGSHRSESSIGHIFYRFWVEKIWPPEESLWTEPGESYLPHAGPRKDMTERGAKRIKAEWVIFSQGESQREYDEAEARVVSRPTAV